MTTIMIEWLISLIPGLPLAAALGIGLAMFSGQAHGESHEPRTCRIALLASAGSLFAVLALIASRLTGGLPETVLLGNWLNSGSLQINLLFFTDRLSLTLAALTGLAGLLALRFAVNYMHREPGFHRFFMILSLFTAAMQLPVSYTHLDVYKRQQYLSSLITKERVGFFGSESDENQENN